MLSSAPVSGSFVPCGRAVGVVLGPVPLSSSGRVIVEIVSRPAGDHHRVGDVLVWQPADWPVPGAV